MTELASLHQSAKAEHQTRMIMHENVIERLKASAREWQLGHHQTQASREAMQQHILKLAQAT